MMPNNNIINQFMNFKRMYQGDARTQIQQMLNSGQITQEQYNNAVQMAQQLQGMLTSGARGLMHK